MTQTPEQLIAEMQALHEKLDMRISLQGEEASMTFATEAFFVMPQLLRLAEQGLRMRDAAEKAALSLRGIANGMAQEETCRHCQTQLNRKIKPSETWPYAMAEDLTKALSETGHEG